jgi:hypothetical protein
VRFLFFGVRFKVLVDGVHFVCCDGLSFRSSFSLGEVGDAWMVSEDEGWKGGIPYISGTLGDVAPPPLSVLP